jgi:hypothetical protein
VVLIFRCPHGQILVTILPLVVRIDFTIYFVPFLWESRNILFCYEFMHYFVFAR